MPDPATRNPASWGTKKVTGGEISMRKNTWTCWSSTVSVVKESKVYLRATWNLFRFVLDHLLWISVAMARTMGVARSGLSRRWVRIAHDFS
jgi:hypothetical protein